MNYTLKPQKANRGIFQQQKKTDDSVNNRALVTGQQELCLKQHSHQEASPGRMV